MLEIFAICEKICEKRLTLRRLAGRINTYRKRLRSAAGAMMGMRLAAAPGANRGGVPAKGKDMNGRKRWKVLDTVLFDMGGTLEDINYDETTARRVTLKLMEMLRAEGLELTDTPESFWEKVDCGVKRYKAWSQSVDLELKPEEIWPDFYLRAFDFDRDTVVKMAEDLASMWEVTYFNRRLRPGVVEMLDALQSRGYKLGIISNTAALYSVFHVLEEYGIRSYFEDVTLSSVTGYRKPHEGIFRISLYEMQTRPENAVYVGDTMSRDIIGSKRAGFAVAVQIKSFMTGPSDKKVQQSEYQPDFVITDFSELVRILDNLRENAS